MLSSLADVETEITLDRARAIEPDAAASTADDADVAVPAAAGPSRSARGRTATPRVPS